MKRIILSILSVFITLGAAAETEQALPAVQRAATAAVEETPSGNEDTVPPETSDTPGTGTEATAETASGLAAETGTAAAAGTLGAPAAPSAPMPAAMPAEKHKRPQVERFLPTRRRIDREINKLKFAYKGEVMMGLTASYGTVSSDDTDLMLIFDNIDADATIATVKPFVGYFYRDNNCIGIRFGYSHMGGTLDNTYFSQTAKAETTFVLWKRLVLRANADYNYYRGITDTFLEERLICNAMLGVKLFRNCLGEASVGVNDILDQNGTTFRRTVSGTTLRNVTNLAVGRYVSFQFSYNLRLSRRQSIAVMDA